MFRNIYRKKPVFFQINNNKYTNFKAIDTKSVAFFYFTKKGERNDG